MTEPACLLTDGRPLITAAQLGKLRLVRVLVEGGAQVNERNARGETPLLAACRSLRAHPSEPMLRLIQFLLNNRADPNIQDKTGRTALMYACMERAGAELASALIVAGADATMEDYSGGASALVYAINAQDPDTLTVLVDACRSRGREIIIIATDLSCDASASRYLNVAPSPDTSPVSCMSPSDIELNTNSPNSDGENIFSFRADGSPARSRSRLRSEPWLAIQNLAALSHAYEKSLEDAVEEGEQDKHSLRRGFPVEERDVKLRNPSERRNTLPDLLPAPSLKLTLSGSDTHLHRTPFGFPSVHRTGSLFLAPPDGLRSGNRRSREQMSGLLPPLPDRSGGNEPLRDSLALAPVRRLSLQLQETL
ncbi:LOW QUALITY PROTEIN: ankyrin repeat domain-containing protein 34C [Rhinichthys klamathensis goyatoka]|uniref:LOW QUALITY PROTEIN: ankyrin repeat domain-containing protein 34C n=1 Tax=Rhinichthys klamathensis goyatoka TaxID=3034132 RepID=UPI0024B63658|nr:LOW QUALITY PROTEIN: ankyrin repeat domain-containing protein 34C [Rhinichthys klamathensis goyatoka]